MRRSFSTSLMALLWIGGSSAFADSEITRHVFSAGGGTATSAHHSVRATLGQPTAGNASSFHHDVGSGFWAGQSESVLGDMNCDGDINNFDIDPFVIGLVDPEAYELLYPDCNRNNGDVNGDGNFDNFDIDPFVDCLINGCP